MEQRKTVLHLSAILRLADSFDSDRSSLIEHVGIRAEQGLVVVYAKGYAARSQIAEGIAAARHLLELVYRRPVMVRASK